MRKRLGMCYLNVGQFEYAETHFRCGLELDSEDFEMHFNIAQALELQEKFKEALHHFEKCTELRKNSALAWFRTGTAIKD